MRRLLILGSTGSIGRQAVDVIARFPDRFQVVGVVAGRDLAGLRALAREELGASRNGLSKSCRPCLTARPLPLRMSSGLNGPFGRSGPRKRERPASDSRRI